MSRMRSAAGQRREIMEPRVPEPPGSPRLLRPRSVGELLTDAFELYRQHWQNLFVIVAVIVIPLSFLQVLVGDFWIRQGLTEEELRNGIEVVETGTFAGAILGSIVVAITSILMWTVLTGAITRAAAGTFLGRDLELGESYRYGFARFWSIVLVGLLSGLAIAVGFVLLIVPGFNVLTVLSGAIPALVI